MRNKDWEAIHTVFIQMEELFGQLKKTHSSGDARFSAGATDSDVVRVRADIRSQLDLLRVHLSERLSERESYLILFPIVIYFDELVQAKYLQQGQVWPTLQRELYQIDDGGVLFYETLDEILKKPQTLPLVYEVFYFCIHWGFLGRYNDDPVKIHEYKNKLLEKISTGQMVSEPALTPDTFRMKKFHSPLWYYAGAAGIIVGCYYLLKLIANYARPI